MPRAHIALGVLIAAIWGLNFVAIRIGLDDFPPLELAALRFLLAGLPAFVIPRPRIAITRLILIGTLLFGMQFALLFAGIAAGMPPGLASAVMQTQVFLTILFALFLRERPTGPQILGGLVAASGLVLIAASIGGDLTALGLILTLLAATSWACGNILLRRTGSVDLLALVVWASLVPPVPLLAASAILEGGPEHIIASITGAHWAGWVSLTFIAFGATLGGYGAWAFLLRHYKAAMVTPFALLVPPFGMISSALAFGEQFTPGRLLGVALIMSGLAIGLFLRRTRSIGVICSGRNFQ